MIAITISTHDMKRCNMQLCPVYNLHQTWAKFINHYLYAVRHSIKKFKEFHLRRMLKIEKLK